MSFNESVKTCFNKYFKFKGRAIRSEYWYFVLFVLLMLIVLFLIEFGVYWLTNIPEDTLFMYYYIIDAAILLFLLIPLLSVSFRRLHDTDRNGGYVLMSLIPIIGSILYIIYLCQDSDFGENHYGFNPKGLYKDSLGRIVSSNNVNIEEKEDNSTLNTPESVSYAQPWKG